MQNPQIGKCVQLNDGVAPAYQNLTGSIVRTRICPINGTLWIVKLDTPTPPAPNWPIIEELGVTENCLQALLN